ncbi:hypothetical protein HG535_0H02920 [Zygotorulaspora mrakii]|uniref:Uncharacterized protein n=1 Tax=Zygotorulaspora mrakii TaxID=42260 RepID=A0A7H9B8F4_ZYGMR|nr:uncharacterized protein HG535_0H02920 [Zygotorulaspora mrakii]QLG74965.1 hypothetical protein HG535_0H02920 [Zygotorulaspora mrakii]
MKSKLVRKHPTVKAFSRREIKSHIYIKSVTPYVSALKRIKKVLTELDKSSATFVAVLGMGKAVEKTLSLGCHFEEQMGKRIEVLTKTIEVLDEVTEVDSDTASGNQELQEENEDLETILKKRTLSGVEVRIYA